MKTTKQNKPKNSIDTKRSQTPKQIAATKVKNKDFQIVGIGASAGGLEALEQFFGNVPKNNGLAFVVIQHLDPNHVGIMPELLQRISTMKVVQASDMLTVMPNRVYVIPPNKSMSLLNGALHLFDPVEYRGLRLPIDIFFRSLADDKHEKSIGVILSGMGSDGSMGLKSIKEKNGIVLVQDPSSAKFDGMPLSACNSVIADIVAPANELPTKLVELLKFTPEIKVNSKKLLKDKDNLAKIIILLRDQSGHDFSLYKKNTLFRRIERRKSIHQIYRVNDYVRFLQENPGECKILFKELLIGVTSFFRDAAIWEMLKENVFPEMFKDLPDGYVVRAWVPGCSTGEEVYSLAIIFKEAMEKAKIHKNITMQIFGTDLDNESIEKARKGSFSKNISADVSPLRLSKFFIDENNRYNVNSTIREMVIFASQNVIKDPPFTKLDFLSCRNMLIYMEPELQKSVIFLFKYSLKPRGILLLGSSETLGNLKDGFIEIDSKMRIFRNNEIIHPGNPIDFPSAFYKSNINACVNNAPVIAAENIQSIANKILLERFTPASVLVNNNGDIIHITGRTGKYLEPVAGKANWNIYAMAREELRHKLPEVFRKAMRTFDAVIIPNIKVGTNGGTQYIDLKVQRIENPESLRGLLMVVFNDVKPVLDHNISIPKQSKQKSTGKVKDLEIELKHRYEDLQSLREEMHTSQEELKLINEEMQSMNEELQSTNEELTTSKEEMQSLNEELETVNVELQSKVNDYVQAEDDMKNLLNSTEIATLFLDKELNIRRFTEHLTKIFKIRFVDIGRPFTDLTTDLRYPEIKNHVTKVLKTLEAIENSIETNDERWFNVRIIPYYTLNNISDGLVITFNEVTIAKKMEIELKKTNAALNMGKDI